MIKLIDVNKSYDNNVVLKNINLHIKKSEIVVLLGPSGVGKTTLIELMLLLQRPTSGTILFDDQNLIEGNKKFYQKVAYIPQSPILVETRSVLYNVLLPKIKNKFPFFGDKYNFAEVDKQKACDLLSQFGLSEFKNQLCENLSLGQKQRVALCQNLIKQPAIIFADEPTASLDIKTTQVVIKDLQKINKANNITIVAAMHDVSSALKLATKIIGIKEKEIVFAESVEKVTKQMIDHIYEKK